MIHKTFALIVSVAFLAACTSPMHITSARDAKIFVDGQFVGTGRGVYFGSSGIGGSRQVMIERAGQRKVYRVTRQYSGTQIALCVILFWPCALWSGFWPTHRYYPAPGAASSERPRPMSPVDDDFPR